VEESGKQHAVQRLFEDEVANREDPCSDHRSQEKSRSNPRIQIGTLRSRDLRPGKQPTTNKQKKRRVLTTPTAPLVHLRLAIPAKRTRASPGLWRQELSYCRGGGGSEEGKVGVALFDRLPSLKYPRLHWYVAASHVFHVSSELDLQHLRQWLAGHPCQGGTFFSKRGMPSLCIALMHMALY
jgi:hypothetical protein